MSLPLVNVRATLRAAQVSSERQAEIISAAQGIFYADRTWPRVFEACSAKPTEVEQILSCELDIKAADALHLCYHIQSLPERPEPAMAVCNANKGYGAVFLNNDRKLFNGKRVIRQHKLALPSFRDAALTRALALEYCKMVGLQAEAPAADMPPQGDLSAGDFKRLRDEEATLAQAREWYSNAASGFEDVPKILDFLRVIGAYDKAKEVVV